MSGLPTQVRMASGKVVSGNQADEQWHKTRADISKFDATAPFNKEAQKRRSMKMASIDKEEQDKAQSAKHDRNDEGIMGAAIGREEVSSSLQRSSKGTAPGTDEVYNELLIQGGDYIQEILHLFFNVVWAQGHGPGEWDCALVRPLYKPKAKDPLLVENYRAVTLFNTMCKIYEDILCARVVHHLETNRGLSPSQAGSRRFLGCTEMVYTLISAVKHRHELKKEGTYACFIDFKLAYPSTDQEVIFTKLHEKGVTGRLWRNIRALYANMRSRVIHPGIPKDDFFNIEIGVREGSVLSPILFLVAVDDMREYLANRPFQHAGPSAQTKPGHRHKRFKNTN